MTLKISKFLLLAVFFVLVFGFFSTEIKDPDFWWHLKTGEYIVQSGSLPETDPFAYTSLQKDPLDPESKRIKFILRQYWLAQVIFYWVHHLAGLQGIIYLRASILTLIMLLAYKGIRREGGGFYLSLSLLVPIGIILHTFTGERPQLFSFLFAFLLIFLLEGFRKVENLKSIISNLSYLLPLPFIMLIWANLHGGFILGVVIVLAYLAAETLKYLLNRHEPQRTLRLGRVLSASRFRILLAAGIISVIAAAINPNGYNVLSVLMEFQVSSYKRMIVESMTPFFLLRSGLHDAYLIAFFAVLAASVLIFLFSLRKLDITDVVITGGIAVMALSSARYIPFFSPVAVFMIVRYGKGLSERLPMPDILKSIGRKVDGAISVILIIALVIVINNSDLFKSGIRANRYPEGAVKFLQSNTISGNMFNPYVWGGYLIWKLYPQYEVFIDGRGLIGEVFFQEVRVMEAFRDKVAGMAEWKAILSAYNVDFIITYSVGNFTGRLVPLIPALLNDPEWRLVYIGKISLIFVRDNGRNNEIIKKFDLPKDWLWNEVAVEAALKSKDYPRNINYYITEGDAFLAKQSYADAQTAYLQALQIDPQNNLVKKRLEFLRSKGYY